MKCSVDYDAQLEIEKEKEIVRELKKKQEFEEERIKRRILEKRMESSPRLKASMKANESRLMLSNLNDSVLKSNNYSQEFEKNDIKL